jgi:hypothetical protein
VGVSAPKEARALNVSVAPTNNQNPSVNVCSRFRRTVKLSLTFLPEAPVGWRAIAFRARSSGVVPALRDMLTTLGAGGRARSCCCY